ncbi:MATE family efflux transporter [Desulfonema ishimotonii]|uniref:MATE family efflux transporter n=1 Tax=Desulfonema ishimotonii TaxID=45657 RepID=A0A401G027_9BACT|nr:MATE family efflux transporter [Desulfonema ishimotonii]GBC62592.1 MATE family efflux transporter [Desulfonema ishimotonii]
MNSVSDDHPFVSAPHATLMSMSFPVLFSLIAEPLTGLADTAFVARLGTAPLAALGVGTMTLSSVFWIFNFLGIGTQTEVARAEGRGEKRRAVEVGGLALALGLIFGGLLIVAGFPLMSPAAALMGATDAVREHAVAYMRVRLLGAPAVLVSIAAFGVLRGLQDMRTPLWVAVGVNVLNLLLDALFIFGWGPVPALGIFGAALASTISQWAGAAWTVRVVYLRLGMPKQVRAADAYRLLRVGGDLFVRTGLVTAFLLLTTRSATQIGADAGAAHQAIRQFWMFTALFLDAFAITGQSLVAYFMGQGRADQVRRVAKVVCLWSMGFGLALGIFMGIVREGMIHLLVPPPAADLFRSAWLVAALMQPVNALAFATDGIHWGTGDYRFLRNVMIAATATGVTGILLTDAGQPGALTHVWEVTTLWVTVRAIFGIMRIWPGMGQSPIARKA